MEAWKRVWRKGIKGLLSDKELTALAKGLKSNSPRLIQGDTVTYDSVEDSPGAACALGYALWKGRKLKFALDVDRLFSEFCFKVNQRCGEMPNPGCDAFLSWFDGGDRKQVFAELLAEVESEIKRRENARSKSEVT